MLSARFYKGCAILVPIFYSLGVFGLQWDCKRKIFLKPPRRNRLFILIAFTFCCIFSFFVFQVFRLYGKSYNEFAFIFLCTMAGCSAIQTNIVTNLNEEDCLMTVNLMILFLRRIHGKLYLNLFKSIFIPTITTKMFKI